MVAERALWAARIGDLGESAGQESPIAWRMRFPWWDSRSGEGTHMAPGSTSRRALDQARAERDAAEREKNEAAEQVREEQAREIWDLMETQRDRAEAMGDRVEDGNDATRWESEPPESGARPHTDDTVTPPRPVTE
jgi:hypothetical protein